MSATFAAGTPHPSLRGVVLRYVGFAEQGADPVTLRELPCSFVPIIVDLDAGWTVAHRQHIASEPQRLRSFVAGITDGPVLVGHGGSARCLQIDLSALIARRLIGVPMSELANVSVPVEAVFGRFGNDLVQRVGETSDWRARFALVDRVLRARLADSSPVDAGVAWSMGTRVRDLPPEPRLVPVPASVSGLAVGQAERRDQHRQQNAEEDEFEHRCSSRDFAYCTRVQLRGTYDETGVENRTCVARITAPRAVTTVTDEHC